MSQHYDGSEGCTVVLFPCDLVIKEEFNANTPVHSSIKFDVKASVDIAGKFDKWDDTLKFISPDETTGVLEIIIQAGS